MMPLYLEVAGEVLVAIGFLIVFLVYKENIFASATIERVPEQKVISTGLYARVRRLPTQLECADKLVRGVARAPNRAIA
jgi:hypothetical protein